MMLDTLHLVVVKRSSNRIRAIKDDINFLKSPAFGFWKDFVHDKCGKQVKSKVKGKKLPVKELHAFRQDICLDDSSSIDEELVTMLLVRTDVIQQDQQSLKYLSKCHSRCTSVEIKTLYRVQRVERRPGHGVAYVEKS